MTAKRCINTYLFAIREWASEERLDEIDAMLEPPNRWDVERRAPTWWIDDDDAWAAFRDAPRVSA